MSTITEKLKWLVEADATSAIKGFDAAGKAAETNLKKAETAHEKLGGQLTKVGAGAMAFAGIAGAALFKAAGSFEDLALTAGKMSDATGLSVEQASRWVEVSGDMGIGADTVETALGKMNKTLGATPQKFKDLGIEIAATKAGTEDVNGTFINTIERLNQIKDPAERAAAAASIFGKGWQGAAELLKLSTGDIKKQLSEVSDQKVINEGELQKAKDYRKDLDHLKDSAEDLAIAIGQGAAPMIGAIASAIGTAVGAFTSLDSVSGGAAGGLLAAGTAALGVVASMTFLAGQAIKVRDRFTTLAEDGVRSMTTFGKGVSVAAGVAAIAIAAYTIDAKQAEQANANLANSIQELNRATDAELMAAFFDVIAKGFFTNKSTKETIDDLAKSNIEGAQRVREHIQALVDAGTASEGQRQSLVLLNAAIADEATARKNATETAGKYKDTTEDATGATEGATIASAASKGALDALKDATAEATRKSDAFAASLKGQLDKLNELYPKEYDAVTAKYDYAKQTETTMIAVGNLNTTLADHKSKQEDVKTATDNARDAILDQSTKFATLDGAAAGSEGAIRRQISSLEDQAKNLAPGSPLRVFLDQYIADLKAIPSNVSTIMDLHISQGSVTTKAGDTIGVRFGAHASGGRIPMTEGVSLVGEQGPELISAPGAHVTNAGQTAAMLGGGGVTIGEVHVHMPVGSDGNDVVRALKTFERRNGTGWRS